MTREEAIDILKCDISADKQGIEYCHNELGIEALDMAIKALEQEQVYTSQIAQKAYENGKKDGYVQAKLEQEPSGDLISRQAVEDIKQEIWTSHKDNYCKSEIVNLIDKHTNGTPLKEGHWVYEPQKRMVNETDEGVEYRTEYRCKCSNCDADYGFTKMKDAYCRYCGARMVEPQESEE